MISDERFGRREHILKTRDFSRAFKNGRPVKKDTVVLYTTPNNLKHCRIGFSIAKKNIKLATGRNRIRRLFREAFRRKKALITPGIDMVVVVKRDPGDKFVYKDAEALFVGLAKLCGALR